MNNARAPILLDGLLGLFGRLVASSTSGFPESVVMHFKAGEIQVEDGDSLDFDVPRSDLASV